MSDSATISLLPVSLSIVHVPRSRIHDLFHPLLRQLLLPGPAFLNLTCNELELSLFAEHHVLRDFQPIAQKDARKLLARAQARDAPAPKSRKIEWEPIEFSAERWNVLQIDSHSDAHGNSGARIHELSAPLAAAGISILYQSSYMSDFIFVKEYRLHEVMSLLASAGFDLYSSDPENLTAHVSSFASPALSPLLSAVDDPSSIQLLDLNAPTTMHTISSESGAVFTRSRSSTDPSAVSDKSPESSRDAAPLASRSNSHSPSGCDVRILEPDLTSIGLSDDTADRWTTKIIKLVAFPDMIPAVDTRRGRSTSGQHRYRTGSDIPSIASDDLRSITGMLGDTVRVLRTPDIDTDSSDSRTDDTTRDGLDTPRDSVPQSPTGSLLGLKHEQSWPDAAAEVDGVSDGDTDESSSSENSAEFAECMEEELYSPPPLAQGEDIPQDPQTRSRSDSASSASEPTQGGIVPFFSFTRTPEGSSLTASVSLLASLFPPEERHMVSCGGELDILDSQVGSPERSSQEGEDAEEDDGKLSGTLKCLQIDLRKFGLDKHGLVCRFSRALDDNGINHMYSSTYKTANLLVEKASAWRAQALLRSC